VVGTALEEMIRLGAADGRAFVTTDGGNTWRSR